jgi:ribonuclease P protein component
LRSASDFAAIQREGRSRGDAVLSVRVRRNGLARARFAFATSRRLGSAVVRNRVRRRLRSIARALAPRLAAGWDVLVVVRPAGAQASQAQLAASLERSLRAVGALGARVGDP